MQLEPIAFAIRVNFRRPQVATTDFVHVRLILIHPPVAHAPVLFRKSYGSRCSYTSKPSSFLTKELRTIASLILKFIHPRVRQFET